MRNVASTTPRQVALMSQRLHEERSIYNSMVRDANLTVAVVLALKLLSITIDHVVMTLERITALTLLSSALHCSLANGPLHMWYFWWVM